MKWWLGALGLLAISMVLRLEYVVFAMYVLLGLLGVSRHWALRWLGKVEVHRQASCQAAEIGDRATLSLQLRNNSRGRIPWLLAEEGLPVPELRQHPPRLLTNAPAASVFALRPGESRDFTYQVEFRMRGFYAFGPMMLESGDLFGLHRRYRVVSEPCFILVRPRVVPLLGYDLASRRPVGEVRISHRFFEDPTRIAGIRPYEKGDSLNRVHWRATARTGSLHSKIYDPSCVAGVTLVLDFHRDAFLNPRARPVMSRELELKLGRRAAAEFRADLEGPDSAWVELAVTTVASIAHAVCELGQQIGLVTHGRDAAERMRVEGFRGEFRSRSAARRDVQRRAPNERLEPITIETRRDGRQLPLLLDLLARLEPTDGFTLPDLLREVSGRMPRDATVAVVLTRVTEEAAIALGNLRRSGFAVTAILVTLEDNDLHDWASAPEWAERLMAEGVPFRRVQDEAGLEQLCAAQFVR
jgi:uncharacterized protein (DUF58 family)